MPWGIAAAAVVGAYSANQQSKAAKGAANAQTRAADAATEEQRRQFDLTRQDQQPWLQAGQNALTQMQALNSGDFSSFKESPDYQFAFDQGLQGLDRSAAARGSLFSGGHSADLMKFGQGLASQNYGNFYNRLAGLSGTGQSTASSLGTLGANTANQIGNNLQRAGQARASAYGASADANSQLAAGVGGAFNKWYMSRPPSGNSTSNYYSQMGGNGAGDGGYGMMLGNY